MYSQSEILKKWKIGITKLNRILKENNIVPNEEKPYTIHSMVYLQRIETVTKRYDKAVIDELLKNIPLRLEKIEA